MKLIRNSNLINRIKNSDTFETLRHSKNYLSAGVATKALGFISIPIFTRLFTQGDYWMVVTCTRLAGLKVVPIVVIGYVFYGMFAIYGIYPGYTKKLYIIPLSL